MPYPNQHSCRLKSPSLFKKDSFRTLKTKQKGLTFITGVLKKTSKSAVQAYRYAKTNWTADRARKHCSSHKGSFEGATTRKQLNLSDENKDYLLVDEITEDVIADIRLNFLYRTHLQLHKLKNNESVQTAHTIVVDEMKKRGMLHHAWDEIDSNYQNS